MKKLYTEKIEKLKKSDDGENPAVQQVEPQQAGGW